MVRLMVIATLMPAALANAAPVQMTHQGRLLNASGVPLNGPHNITVSISSDSSGAQTTHVETFATETQNGYYAVIVGSNGQLDSTDLPNPGWVTIQVDGVSMGTTALGVSAVGGGGSAVVGVDGTSAGTAARSCKQLFDQGVGSNGTYWLDPDGTAGTAAFQAYCDMTTAGGGWTLVHSKQAAGFYPIGTAFDAACASQQIGDCASTVHPAMTWSDALFRFEDTADYAVVVRGWDQAIKDAFHGASYRNSPGTSGVQRWLSGVPDVPVTIANLTVSTNNEQGYVSQAFAGADQHLNLWAAYADTTNNYTSVASGATIGQQCIAGYCRVETAWMLVR